MPSSTVSDIVRQYKKWEMRPKREWADPENYRLGECFCYKDVSQSIALTLCISFLQD